MFRIIVVVAWALLELVVLLRVPPRRVDAAVGTPETSEQTRGIPGQPTESDLERNERLEAARVALYRDPTATGPHLVLGEAYLSAGNLVAARHHLSTYLQNAPSGVDSVRAAYLHARTLFDLGLKLRATQEFSRFIERPGLPAGAFHDYSALLRADRFGMEAVMMESRAIEESEDAAFLREGARQWKELGRQDQAIAWLRRLTEHHPDAAVAEDFFQLGFLSHTARRKDLAVGAYARALDLDPAHAEAHFNTSLIDKSAGQTESAIFHLEQVLRLRPKYEPAYFELATIFLDHDRSIEAADVFRRFLVHGQDSLALAEAKTLLDDLEAAIETRPAVR